MTPIEISRYVMPGIIVIYKIIAQASIINTVNIGHFLYISQSKFTN